MRASPAYARAWAVLVGIRAVVRRQERLSWGLIAAGLAVYAGGNWFWSLVLADLEEAPYPSISDGLWLGFYPLAYAAIVLLARRRMPRLGFRLWLDGLIAALTVAAISAAVVFKAVRASTGGDTAAIAGDGRAYRMGGDEFCVLAPAGSDGAAADLLDRARTALFSIGDGFEVGASCGYARIPDEGLEASDILRVADRRMCAEKNGGRVSALAQSKAVLLRAVGEWDEALSAHGLAVSALAADVARELGHERWDGDGYPDQLAGDEIPLGSQIVFVCDAFAAMTSDRPYQPALPEAFAREELRRNAGGQFAPAVVAAFLEVRSRTVHDPPRRQNVTVQPSSRACSAV